MFRGCFSTPCHAHGVRVVAVTKNAVGIRAVLSKPSRPSIHQDSEQRGELIEHRRLHHHRQFSTTTTSTAAPPPSAHHHGNRPTVRTPTSVRQTVPTCLDCRRRCDRCVGQASTGRCCQPRSLTLRVYLSVYSRRTFRGRSPSRSHSFRSHRGGEGRELLRVR